MYEFLHTSMKHLEILTGKAININSHHLSYKLFTSKT